MKMLKTHTLKMECIYKSDGFVDKFPLVKGS